jgi:hypothetical protein
MSVYMLIRSLPHRIFNAPMEPPTLCNARIAGPALVRSKLLSEIGEGKPTTAR